jgi:hypothetical protein
LKKKETLLFSKSFEIFVFSEATLLCSLDKVPALSEECPASQGKQTMIGGLFFCEI